jgi:hypothetical protein
MGTNMNEIRIEKSLRRKIAEVFLFFWGIVGLGISLLIANEAFRFDFQSRVAETVLPGMIVYMLIWIGGLIFFGFFTLFAPVKMVLGPTQDRTSGKTD